MDGLIAIIGDGLTLVKDAKGERDSENYTYSSLEDKYTLTHGDALMRRAQELYQRYANWLENFSLSK